MFMIKCMFFYICSVLVASICPSECPWLLILIFLYAEFRDEGI